MNSCIRSLLDRASGFRKPGIVLGLISLTALVTVTALAESWENKDWTQWSSQDCSRILTNSPWAEEGPETRNYYFRSPGRAGETLLPTALIGSALVVRQALERQAQFDQHYEKMNPKQRQEFDEIADACISMKNDDRIVMLISLAKIGNIGPVRLFVNDRLFVDDREVPALPRPQNGVVFPCHGADKARAIAFHRVAEGKPVIQPGDKKIVFETPPFSDYHFKFDLEKMIYKGKLDY
jgi:hypothetical protein